MFNKEHRLIKKCIKGDIDAFEQLISQHEKIAYNIALKMLKNPDDALDISQEAFIKVYKSIGKFNFESSFSTWLYRIVTNTCLDFLRKNKKKIYSIDNPIQTGDGEMQREFADEGDTPEEIVEKEITKEIVHKCIDQLEDNHRTIIILRDIQEFSYEEISQILDCSIGTVKSRINRARNKLKQVIIYEMEQNDETIV